MSQPPRRASRRHFIFTTAAALGTLATIPRGLRASALARTTPGRGTEPRITRVDLTVGHAPIVVGGRRAMAVAVDESVPGPTLRFREGDDAVIRVTNTLAEPASIHWHGVILPNGMDGVPQVTFPGIPAGTTFEYRFPIRQAGTYWYHSHSGMQEQLGVYGAIVIEPSAGDGIAADRDYVVQLSDWTFEDPDAVMAHLKQMGGYYNYQRQTLLGLLGGHDGPLRDRLPWAKMRMDPTDLADVTGATYHYLVNGRAPDDPWRGRFIPGERVRLRLINSGAATFFDVRIPGLPMTVVQADGQPVEPVTVEEIRVAIAETYDVIVQPREERAYAVFAETLDRSGYALGVLSPRDGLVPDIPARRPRPRRSMMDMGMAMGSTAMPGMADMPGMSHAGHAMGSTAAPDVPHGPDDHGPGNSMVPAVTAPRLDDPGIGLGGDGWRVLTYRDLRSAAPTLDERDAGRDLELHLTGNMERYMWSFDGRKYSDARDPIPIGMHERVRITFVNDTMMEHPIHLHGMWMVLENGAGERQPRKHTVNVKPAERVSVLVEPDVPGRWALHCHILYHMETGMFRVVEVPAHA
ncbi:MAG: copper resistance system multicopper oxidase [Gemmatimonadota bacterium]|nr:copper resistance system multicopper oxidase [Gemmatimonadota bacterium]